MNLTISLDNLDEAITKLQELSDKLLTFTEDMAEESKERVRYNDATVSVDRNGNEVVINNEGKRVAFQEFGAGFFAQNADFDDFHTEPGIWSEDHRQTFQRWTGDPSNYPYNRIPQRKMQRETEHIRNEVDQKAKEYFA